MVDKVDLYSATGQFLASYRQHQAQRLLAEGSAEWMKSGKSLRITHKTDAEKAAEEYPVKQVVGRWDDSMLPTNTHCATRLSRLEHERRFRERNAQGSHTEAEWQEILERFGNRCLRCTIRAEDTHYGKLTKDHVVPLASGGTSYASNLQPLCRQCNSWKGNREIDFRSKRSL